MKLDLVEEFKHLPSTLGIKNNKSHFEFLTQIIDEEVRKFPKNMQKCFHLLMISFKSKHQTRNKKNSKFKKIQELFFSNQLYKESLRELISQIKEKFNMIN